jgi:hypothetical protein
VCLAESEPDKVGSGESVKKEENAKEADDELQVLGRILQDENAAVIKEGREKKREVPVPYRDGNCNDSSVNNINARLFRCGYLSRDCDIHSITEN